MIMERYKKILVKSILLILACFLLCYCIGAWNFSIIRNGFLGHIDYAFNMLGSKWKCKSHNLEAIITYNSIGQCMVITDLNTGLKYTAIRESDIVATIHPYKDNPSIYDIPLSEVKVISKKRWGKLYKFIIKGVNRDLWYESGNDSISFELVEEYTSEWWDERQKSLRSE